jgi:glycosyltransferase involved in cell wall biosynthesis
VDAALWFCREILPQIQRQFSDVKLLIVGHHPRPEILTLSKQPHIIVTGHVPDVRPYYEQASVCIAPLRAGGGTRLKILEAMALGRPVVSTLLGCEGLHVTHGKELLIADTPSEFAEQVMRLFQSQTLREQLAHQARTRVEVRYDWNIIGQKLLKVYDDIARRQKP